MYESRNPPEQPPCDTCRVDPVSDNADALKVFFMVQDQYIFVEGNPIAINHLAIHEAMRLLKIKNRLKCFNNVCRLSSWWINQIKE
jgi:hypothetical protein